MTAYFLRRLLLVPLTFVCISFIVYAILRSVPGGPVEEAKRRARGEGGGEAGAGATAGREQGAGTLTKKQVEQIQAYYRVDRSIPVGYGIWLWGILRGDFGASTEHSAPVFDVIVSKFRVSVYFGLIGFLATYLVCVPLGVFKALQHRTFFDTSTSVLVFLGYAIPGFVACLVLLVLFGGGSFLDLVPLGGVQPKAEIWDALSMWGKIKARLHHTIVPVIGYLIGSFASMTVVMKNSLLENLGSDYVRTAFAKGLPERRVIFVHALRNSVIPITAGLGHALSILLAGSFFIEKVCDIDGMGYLGVDSIFRRDYPVIMGVLVFSEVLFLMGNIFSDLIWAAVDPRIRFE